MSGLWKKVVAALKWGDAKRKDKRVRRVQSTPAMLGRPQIRHPMDSFDSPPVYSSTVQHEYHYHTIHGYNSTPALKRQGKVSPTGYQASEYQALYQEQVPAQSSASPGHRPVIRSMSTSAVRHYRPEDDYVRARRRREHQRYIKTDTLPPLPKQPTAPLPELPLPPVPPVSKAQTTRAPKAPATRTHKPPAIRVPKPPAKPVSPPPARDQPAAHTRKQRSLPAIVVTKPSKEPVAANGPKQDKLLAAVNRWEENGWDDGVSTYTMSIYSEAPSGRYSPPPPVPPLPPMPTMPPAGRSRPDAKRLSTTTCGSVYSMASMPRTPPPVPPLPPMPPMPPAGKSRREQKHLSTTTCASVYSTASMARTIASTHTRRDHGAASGSPSSRWASRLDDDDDSIVVAPSSFDADQQVWIPRNERLYHDIENMVQTPRPRSKSHGHSSRRRR
ncbi:hypothetical protein HDZ31DRAFT_64123 [Schizophyllum fasciatum]